MLKLSLIASSLIALVAANEFFVDEHKIPDEFFKGIRASKTPEERLNSLNQYIGNYMENKTNEEKNLPFVYRKIYGTHVPKFAHDEVKRVVSNNIDPECLDKLNKLPFIKRVWAKSNHVKDCPQCNGLNDYKRQLDEKMLAKIHNLTLVEEQLRHGKSKQRGSESTIIIEVEGLGINHYN